MKIEHVLRDIRGLPDELSHIDAILWAEGFDPRMSAEDKALVQRRRAELAKAAEGRR